KRLWDALPDQEECIRNTDRKENVERAARDIDPEAADGAHRMPRKAANKRDREHDTCCSREIVLVRQAKHLNQITQRAFATVVLPIGVSNEADRGVERQVFGYCGLLGWIERQERLQPHQCVDDEQAT